MLRGMPSSALSVSGNAVFDPTSRGDICRLDASKATIRSSIFFSRSVTRASVRFLLRRTTGSLTHLLLLLTHLRQAPLELFSSTIQPIFSARHVSHAFGGLTLAGSDGDAFKVAECWPSL